MKGTFVRLTLETKNMDRKTSKTALGGDLLSAKDSQLSVVINNVLRKQSGYKLVERECIKRALSSGIFGVLQREAASYLPHPELASAAAPRKPVTATAESDSEEEREVARDIKASQRHEAERMAEAKAAKSSKDKGKVVLKETQKKKPSVPSQAPREKLLGSSFSAAAAETARISRESKTDSLKRKRESQVMPPPPPKVPVRVTSESSEEEENIASDKEESEESDSGL
ncbi:hypothetical protein R1sor_022152 [Riccia sorocarpa]|uniref:Uncharacterized protein n=1 Tax=Riccia sorocarpa TaxID=122646 RepID=A0ABD3GMV0_9MARC